MTPERFIMSRLDALRAAPRFTDDHLEETIYAALMSKKFRKYSNTEQQKAGIKNAIHLAVTNKTPIQLLWPFGAYKLWRFDEAPEADWAELFTMLYLARWMKPVADIYEPGIEFVFSADSIIVGRMNNLSAAELEAYAASFNAVISFLGTYLPENMSFLLVPIGSLYTPDEFEADLAERINEYQAQFEGGYQKLSKEDIASIELNVRLLPGQSDDPLWREKVDVLHNAYYAVKKRRPFNRAPEKIAAFVTPLPNYNCIAVGTTKTSIAKFWAGVGALHRRGDSYIETVLSPNQLEHAACSWEPMRIAGLTGKNFNRVRILND